MALQPQELQRVFKYNSVDLPDPGAQFDIQQVRDLYAATYPEIVNAAVEGPDEKDGKLVYIFRRAVGRKGTAGRHKTGAELISDERARQVREEGYDSTHDDEHDDGSLVLAAVCYATPIPVYVRVDLLDGTSFIDAWPASWDTEYDKRPRDDNSELVPAEERSRKLRVRELAKAGALVAAEIDRLLRLNDQPEVGSKPE